MNNEQFDILMLSNAKTAHYTAIAMGNVAWQNGKGFIPYIKECCGKIEKYSQGNKEELISLLVEKAVNGIEKRLNQLTQE